MEKNLKVLEDVSDNSLIEGMSDLSFADIWDVLTDTGCDTLYNIKKKEDNINRLHKWRDEYLKKKRIEKMKEDFDFSEINWLNVLKAVDFTTWNWWCKRTADLMNYFYGKDCDILVRLTIEGVLISISDSWKEKWISEDDLNNINCVAQAWREKFKISKPGNNLDKVVDLLCWVKN